MSRGNRISRDTFIDLDLDDIKKFADSIGATKTQIKFAYSRALKRTASELRMKSVKLLKEGLGPRKSSVLKRRLMVFRNRNGGEVLDEMKLWYGLNQIKVKDLKGRINAPRKRRHSRRDPTTGRYIPSLKGPGENQATFTATGSALGQTTFDDAFAARSRTGRRTIFIKHGRSIQEAEIDIYEPLLNKIEDKVFDKAYLIFQKHFERELRARVSLNL